MARPNYCDWFLPGGQILGCGFIEYIGGMAEEVYIDTENDNKCTVESITAQDALSVAHCCSIPPQAQFSCNYPSKHEFDTVVSVQCAANEMVIGCQSVGPSCIGYSDCSQLIAVAVGNFMPPLIESGSFYDGPYFVDDINLSNNYCTAHEQHFYNGFINVQATCCSVGSGHSLQCKQIVGELNPKSSSSHLYCDKILGDGWFVTGCNVVVDGQNNVDDGALITQIRPEGTRCVVEVERKNNPGSRGYYPIAQCCRIIEQ